MANVVITMNGTGAQRMLARYKDPAFTRRAQQATVQGAEVLRRPLQREGGKVSRRMGKAVTVRQAKRNRPAAVATFQSRVAWFRHFIIGGTRAHGPRRRDALRFRGAQGWVTVKRVRGVRPNPILKRVAAAYQKRVYAAMTRTLTHGSTR